MELLERESYLRELGHLLDDAADRRGRIVFLGGEAGVGKSSLVEEFCRRVEHEAESIRASCDALSTPGPLNSIRPYVEALGLTFGPNLHMEHARDELVHAMIDAIDRRSGPVLMVGEDAHWADGASLDLARHIGRRIDRLPLLLIVTYRDDEVGPYHPLQRILGDLATAPGYRRLSLAPLSEAAVRSLAAGSDFDPSVLYQQTGGNPFYVTEVLAAGNDVVPATVSDAVLARASRLSPNARLVLGTASAFGATLDPDVLAGIVGPVLDEIEECVACGLLRPQGEMLRFRHQIARDAIYATLLPPRRRLLHQRILAALRELPDRDARLAELAHHAELAQDREATLEFAVAAAGQARNLRAHREAAQQYDRALRHADDLPPRERAELLEAWAYECNLTNRPIDAIDGFRAALEIWRELGEPVKVGENLRWLSRACWFAGRSVESDEAARAALAVLAPLPAGPQLAWAYSNLSHLRMLTSDRHDAVAWGERAIALAQQLGEHEIEIHALTSIGSARMIAGEPTGVRQLEQSLALALEAGFEDHAARAWTNLAARAIVDHQFDLAWHYLADSIAYATEHDLDSYRHYLTAWRAVVKLYRGDWHDVETDCVVALGQPHSLAGTRAVALTALGRLRARRGDPEASPTLQEALSLAEPNGEVVHLGPACAALAEAAWLGGTLPRIVEETRSRLRELSDRLDPWLRGEITWWLWLADESIVPPGDIADPYALQIAGNWAAAAEAWETIGCPYEAARARLASADEAALRSALATFERLDAKPAADMALQRLREIGASTSRRGRNRATRAHPAGLTAREADILTLIVDGRTNREIAERLYLSPKTVEHHVTAILGKLGVPSRREAARVVTELDIASADRSQNAT